MAKKKFIITKAVRSLDSVFFAKGEKVVGSIVSRGPMKGYLCTLFDGGNRFWVKPGYFKEV